MSNNFYIFELAFKNNRLSWKLFRSLSEKMGMTLPRKFLPNTTYFITRRCTQRQFLLKPTRRNTQIFLYCLGVAAKKTGVIIHAVCVMSNHYHIVVSDPDTRVAEFYGWVHKYVAKALNVSYDRFENLWSSEKTSVVVPESNDDLLDKTVYTLTNPVAARLVASGEKWPGVWLYKKSHSQVVKRPDVYFQDNGKMPKTIQLTIEPPSQFGHLGLEKYEKLLAEKLVEEAAKIAMEMEDFGQSFLGIAGIMKQRYTGKPTSRAKHFGINPKVAAKNKWLRMEALQRNKELLFQYREALKRWKKGDRKVLFPAGTYALRVQHNAKCEPG